jgi:hypothetical protein
MTIKRCSRKARTNVKNPAREESKFEVTLGLLFGPTLKTGILTGLCRFLKGLAITSVLVLGSHTTERRHNQCTCLTSVREIRQQDKTAAENSFCRNKASYKENEND